MPPRRKPLSSATTKQVAASQKWRCNLCDTLLPAAYQIDHRTPLWAGGPDCLANLQALCPNCHAAKTQTESIARQKQSERADKAAAYDDRNDVVVSPGVFRCDSCFQRRPIHASHPVCWAIERRFALTSPLPAALDKYAYRPVAR